MTINELGKIASSYKWEVWHGMTSNTVSIERDYYGGAFVEAKRGIVKFDFRDKQMPSELILAIIEYANTKKKKRG